MMKDKAMCPVCDSPSSIELEYRRDIPIAQNLVFKDPQAARNCAVGQLKMLRCRKCGFVWNALFDPALMQYDETYDNDQNFSGVFRKHVDSIAQRVLDAAPEHRKVTVLEIGCGQGSFLSILADRLGPRLDNAVGFDPAWRGDNDRLPPGAKVVRDYFTPQTVAQVGSDPDIVVSRHTIEHVPEPIPFLRAIRTASMPGTIVLIETPTVDWILQNGMFFDFFYEHCSIFNLHSISVALRKAGLDVVSTETVFNGQYLLATCRVPDNDQETRNREESPPDHDFDDLDYRKHRDAYIAQFKEMIGAFDRSAHSLALWGGASKGVTVALMLEDERERIACAIDINPGKQGGFLPGTGIPILSPFAASEAGIQTAIILNPNYADEIEHYCRENAIAMALLTI